MKRTAKMRLLLSLVVLALAIVPSSSFSSPLDNKGTEFVLGFQTNLGPRLNGDRDTTILYITGDLATAGSVTVGSGSPIPFSVTPGTTTNVVIPLSARVSSNGIVETKGILVSASAEIVVYGLNHSKRTSKGESSIDAFLGLPTDILGKEYIVLSFAGSSVELGGGNGGGVQNTPSQFMVVGVEADTHVTITPSAAAGGHEAGVAVSVTLGALQTYQLQANGMGDLSGSIITSDKPVAVFAGAQCAKIPAGSESCSHLVEQLPPTHSWATRFATFPLAPAAAGEGIARLDRDLYRIIASEDGTELTIDGVLATIINRGEFHTVDNLIADTPHIIEASAPVMVVQYGKGYGVKDLTNTFEIGSTGPFMMWIPGARQFQKNYVMATPPAPLTEAEEHISGLVGGPTSFDDFLNLVVRNGGAASCWVDGVLIPHSMFAQIGTSRYWGAQEMVAAGTHNVSCDHPFGLSSYGLASPDFVGGAFEVDPDSYGYPAGFVNIFPMRHLTIVKAKAEFKRKNASDDFAVKVVIDSDFWLNTHSDGLEIVTALDGVRFIDEEVTLSFAGLPEVTIAAGLLRENDTVGGPNVFSYHPATGLLNVVEIAYEPELLPLSGMFSAKWKGDAPELADLIDQVMAGVVDLHILLGNDEGADAVDFNGPNVKVSFKGDPLLELKIEVK